MKIRFAAYLPAGPLPAWIGHLLAACHAIPGVELATVLRDSEALPGADWADCLDALVFDRGASPLKSAVLHMPAGVAEWSAGNAGPMNAGNWLAEQACDVLLDLRTHPAPIPAGPPRHWSLMLAGRSAVDPLAGAAPVVAGADTTTIRLESVSSGHLIDASLGASCTFSIRRNRRRAIAKGMGMVRRALLRLAGDGSLPPLREGPVCAPHPLPSLTARARFSTLLRRSVARSAVKALSRDQWGIALAFGEDICFDPARAQLILPPADRFWADPMVWPAAGEGWWVFIEQVIYKEGRGTLQAIRVHRDGNWEAPVPVMVRPWHLSYPFLFWWDGALWMVPESGANRTVELYRCTALPDRWEKVQDILTDIDLVDATLFAHDGRWWLMGNVSEPGADKHDELHIFHAPTPRGPWQPHAANPVVADARFARPAGPVFSHAGKLLRPAQVCVPEYGHALSLRCIDRLTTSEYVEHTELRIDPGWLPGIACVHTLSHQSGLTVFDFLTRRSRLGPPAGPLRRALQHGAGRGGQG